MIHKIGVIGHFDRVNEKQMRETVKTEFKKLKRFGYRVEILIPIRDTRFYHFVAHLAKKREWKLVGVGSSHILPSSISYDKIILVDETMEEGFVDSVDCIIRVGGKNATLKIAQKAKDFEKVMEEYF